MYSSSQGCHTGMGTHVPNGITQCYLPPGRGDILALTPAEAGTRLSDPGGWVDLVSKGSVNRKRESIEIYDGLVGRSGVGGQGDLRIVLQTERSLLVTSTRSSAIAEGPREASCQLKSCQLPRNSAETILVRQVLNQVSAVANWPVRQNRAADSAWRSVR